MAFNPRGFAEGTPGTLHHLLRAALDATTDAVYLKEPNGRYVLMNRAGAAGLGLTPEEMIGRRDCDVFAPESIAAIRDVDNRVLNSGETVTVEESLVTPTGVRIFQSTKSVYFDEDGRPAGVFGISRDITERRRAEDERDRLQQSLERRNREMESFAYLAAHDLRQPLQVVGGFALLLSQRYSGEFDERADKYLAAIDRGVDTMSAMVESLLEFAQAGRAEPPETLTDTAQVVADVVEGLGGVLDGGRIVVRGPLPVLPADPAQLSRLFQNLIGNSLKFRGDEPALVEVGAERVGDDWLFTVRDNGMGISPEFSEQMFGMFQRERRGDHAGSGLGLAICRRIVEHHGGRIWFEPAPEGGSVFSVTLPAAGAGEPR
jgi:PAS domain S-box-containing protein